MKISCLSKGRLKTADTSFLWKPRVYVAGPLSTGSESDNVRTALAAAESVIELGGLPFVPHLSHFWHLIHPHSYDFWMGYDAEWLCMCDAILVLPGKSPGAKREEKMAKMLGLDVWHGVDAMFQMLRSSNRGGQS